jgi:glycerophosphoryl diester phosphodiesterase
MMRGLALAMLLVASPVSAAAPLVIAHRGASFYLPEETLEAYRLAVRQRADFLEGDVYVTADGVAIMLHDGTLNATTDVEAYAAAHADILALRSPDGSYDATRFTYAQLQRLTAGFRAGRGYGGDRSQYDPAFGYRIATLRQLADLAFDTHLATGRAVGIYPEAKQPGMAVIGAILAVLDDPRYGGYFNAAPRAGIPNAAILQSFDRAQVVEMKRRTRIPVVQLGVCPADAAQASEIRVGADGIGPAFGKTSADCIALAHAAGLFVHPYTFISPSTLRRAYGMGVDGVFTNLPDVAVRLRN